MKKYLFIIAAVAAVCSCAKEPIAQKDSQEKEYTIGIMPVGDISAKYSPLTKTDSEETIWYGINVKCDGSDYRFGIYDDITKFKIQLSTEHNYSFFITAVKSEIQDFIIYRDGLVSSGVIDGFKDPFGLGEVGYYRNPVYHYLSDHDTDAARGWNGSKDRSLFVNTMFPFLCFAHYGNSASVQSSWTSYKRSLPNIEKGDNSNEWYRFYGTKSNFTPSKDETLPFSLKHEGFGLQYSVSGICDGSVSVIIDNAQDNNAVTYFSQPAITTDYTSPQKVFEFRDMTEETEQVKVTVVWTRGNNVVDNLGSTTVNVRRNKVNKINITLGEHSNSGALSISTDASDYFGSESKDITI